MKANKEFLRHSLATVLVLLSIGRASAEDGAEAETEPSVQSESDDAVAEGVYNGVDAASSMRGFSSDVKSEGEQGRAGSNGLRAPNIIPLDSITAKTHSLTDGRILDAELKPRRNGLRYELKVLENDDSLRRYTFDAHSGRLIGVK